MIAKMLRSLMVSSLLACLATGCATARTSHLCVVDAETGQPLSGVRVDRVAFMAQPRIPWVIPPVNVPFPLETVMSDSSGFVHFREEGADFQCNKGGYESIQITGTVSGFKVKDFHDGPSLVLPNQRYLEIPLKKTPKSQDWDTTGTDSI